jgi:hypothetical protein
MPRRATQCPHSTYAQAQRAQKDRVDGSLLETLMTQGTRASLGTAEGEGTAITWQRAGCVLEVSGLRQMGREEGTADVIKVFGSKKEVSMGRSS